jgi:hypothetical protein
VPARTGQRPIKRLTIVIIDMKKKASKESDNVYSAKRKIEGGKVLVKAKPTKKIKTM